MPRKNLLWSKFFLKKVEAANYIQQNPIQELKMRQEQYRSFLRDGGRTFTLHFAAPLSIYAEQAAEVEARTYKEVFRRALEEYLRNHHPSLFQTRGEGHNG